MRSHENHLKRARERLNAFQEKLDDWAKTLGDLQGQAEQAKEQLRKLTREYAEAKTAEAVAKLERKE